MGFCPGDLFEEFIDAEGIEGEIVGAGDEKIIEPFDLGGIGFENQAAGEELPLKTGWRGDAI